MNIRNSTYIYTAYGKNAGVKYLLLVGIICTGDEQFTHAGGKCPYLKVKCSLAVRKLPSQVEIVHFFHVVL